MTLNLNPKNWSPRTRIVAALVTTALLVGFTCETGSPSSPDNDGGFPAPLDAATSWEPAPAPDPSAMYSAIQNPDMVTMILLVRKHELGGKVRYIVHSGAEQEVTVTSKRVELPNGDHEWWVEWNLPVVAEKGKTYGFTWFPKGPGAFAQCTLYYNKVLQDYQHVQRGQCAVSFTTSK